MECVTDMIEEEMGITHRTVLEAASAILIGLVLAAITVSFIK
ncbi:MAG TPA: hypothetical protein VF941_11900 [Clostridia bacterium]